MKYFKAPGTWHLAPVNPNLRLGLAEKVACFEFY